jgi:Fe-S-cluster formation regulator IscX/YfhJ
MALSNRFSGLERRDVRFTDKRFHIYSTETCVRKLLLKFDGDQTVGSKVIALSNRYSGLERRDLRFTELRFHINSTETCVRKLL